MSVNVFASYLGLEDMLYELNERTFSYLHHGLTLEEAQQQALQDFRSFIGEGEYIPTDGDDRIYFVRAEAQS